MPKKKGRHVFISYSHDSPEHARRVLSLTNRLRAEGVEVEIDQYVDGSPKEGWPRWMLDRLDWADFVLVVCTETYYRRFRGREQPGKGKGADWEGALITGEIYDAKSKTTKFIPTCFGLDNQFVPEPLRQQTFYNVSSEDGYERLYRYLTRQPATSKPPIGTIVKKAAAPNVMLAFDSEQTMEVEGPGLSISALSGLDRLLPLAGHPVLRRESDQALVFTGGVKVSFTLAHNDIGRQTVMLRRMELKVHEFAPGPDPNYSHQLEGARIIGAGMAVPQVFSVTLFGKKPGPARWVLDATKGAYAMAKSANFFDTDPPRVLTFDPAKGEMEEIQGHVLAQEAGFYRFSFVFSYHVAGRDLWHESESVLLYSED